MLVHVLYCSYILCGPHKLIFGPKNKFEAQCTSPTAPARPCEVASATQLAAARGVVQVRPSEVPWLRSLSSFEFPKCPPFDGPSRALLVHNSRANPPLPATLPGPPSSPPCPLLAACWLRALRGPTLQHYRHDQARQRACGAQGGRRGVIFDGAHEGPAALSDGQIDAFPTQPQAYDRRFRYALRVFSSYVVDLHTESVWRTMFTKI